MERQKKTFSQIISILMVAGGVINILLSAVLSLFIIMGALAIVGEQDMPIGELSDLLILLLLGVIIAIFGGLIQMVAGYAGIRNDSKPEKYRHSLVWGIIAIAFNVVIFVYQIIAGGSVLSIVFMGVFGVVLSVLFLIGAFKSKKAFISGITSSGVPTNREIKRIEYLRQKEADKIKRKEARQAARQAAKAAKAEGAQNVAAYQTANIGQAATQGYAAGQAAAQPQAGAYTQPQAGVFTQPQAEYAAGTVNEAVQSVQTPDLGADAQSAQTAGFAPDAQPVQTPGFGPGSSNGN